MLDRASTLSYVSQVAYCTSWSLWFCTWFEREDPAGLYTFSRAYDSVTVGGNTDIFNIGNIDSNQYRVDGFRLGYNLDTVSFSVAAGNPTEAREESNNGGAAASEDNLDYEFAVSFKRT